MRPGLGIESVACVVCDENEWRHLFDVQTRSVVECASCGVRRLSPFPSPDELKDVYGESYYGASPQRRHKVKATLWAWMRDSTLMRTGVAGHVGSWLSGRAFDIHLSPDFGVRSQASVLDVGCGGGDLVAYLHSRGVHVTGLEMNPASVEAAQAARLPVLHESLQQHHEVVGINAYDVLIFSHVLEHLEDPMRELRLARQVVRESGYVHIALPNGDAAGLLAEREAWLALCYPEHLWHFSLRHVDRMLDSAGFRVVSVRYAHLVQPRIRQMLRRRMPTGSGASLARGVKPGDRDLLRVVARAV